jgi:undecaprenyl-diphosphatase
MGRFEWLGGHERGTLLTFALFAAFLLAFVAIPSHSFDSRILLAMRHGNNLRPVGSGAVLESALDITALGSTTVLVLFTLIAAGGLALSGRSRAAWLLCGSLAGSDLAMNALKWIVARARPQIVPHETHASGSSFPSGHALLSAAIYLTFAVVAAADMQRLRGYLLAVALVLTILIGLTRVYLGVHWPTDVLAGWILGALWALLMTFVHNRSIVKRASGE